MKISLKQLISQQIYLWLVLILSTALFPIDTVGTSPDSAWYMSNALNIFQGYGYVDTDQLTAFVNRGPVFPALIALSFWFFGLSIHSAMLVVRLFFILNNVIIYKLGADLFGRKVGFLGALFCLFTWPIHRWSAKLLLDNIWPFFILLSLWSIFKACTQKKSIWFIFSGLCLSIAFMTKEVAVLWLPVPIIYVMLVNRIRCRENIIGVFVLYVTFCLCLIPWSIHVYENCGTLKALFGSFSSPEVQGSGKLSQVFGECSKHGISQYFCKFQIICKSLSEFYRKYIQGELAIPGIFILISCGALFLRAFLFRNQSDVLLALVFLCLLPLASGLGITGMRVGQALIIYFLSLLALAHFTVLCWQVAFKKIYGTYIHSHGWRDCLSTVSIMVVFAAIVVYCLLNDSPAGRRMRQILKTKPASAAVFFDPATFPVKGWHDNSVRRVGLWIHDNLPEQAVIMCEWYHLRSIYFFNRGRNKMVPVPIRQSNLMYPGGQDDAVCSKDIDLYHWKCEKSPLFLWSNHDRINPKRNLFAFCECDILDRIGNENINYVIVTKRRNFLSLYFDENPCFRKIREMNQGEIKIYEILCAEPVSRFEMRTGRHLVGYLKQVRKKRPGKYEYLMNQFLPNRLGLGKNAVQGIFKGIYSNITKNEVM